MPRPAKAPLFHLDQPVVAQDCLGVWRPGWIVNQHQGGHGAFQGFPFLRSYYGYYCVRLIAGAVKEPEAPAGFLVVRNVRIHVHESQIRAQ